MKLILISNPSNLNKEHTILCSLFENGLEHFHLRKPDFTLEQLEEYIQQVPKEHLKKIVLHSHHQLVEKYNLKGKHKSGSTKNSNAEQFISTSFHSIDEIKNCNNNYQYAFLSPIYDSISKENYKADFDLNGLKLFLSTNKKEVEIIALGGIDENTIPQAVDLGFDGVAVLGAIWNSENPIRYFANMRKLLEYEF